jgi:AraC family transcriptional activator of mtrCDE
VWNQSLPFEGGVIVQSAHLFDRCSQMNSIDTLIALANLRGSLDLRCQFQGE